MTLTYFCEKNVEIILEGVSTTVKCKNMDLDWLNRKIKCQYCETFYRQKWLAKDNFEKEITNNRTSTKNVIMLNN